MPTSIPSTLLRASRSSSPSRPCTLIAPKAPVICDGHHRPGFLRPPSQGRLAFESAKMGSWCGATTSRAPDGARRPRLCAVIGRRRESPLAIGAILEAFLALLSRKKSKGEPAYVRSAGDRSGSFEGDVVGVIVPSKRACKQNVYEVTAAPPK